MFHVFAEERPSKACGLCDRAPASYVPDLGDLCERCLPTLTKEEPMSLDMGMPKKDRTTEEREYQCFIKAMAKGMPMFTLIAQDISAPILVDQWAAMNELALGKDHPKIVEAREVANLMRAWPHRRQAD